MRIRRIAISAAFAAGLATLPLSAAEAQYYPPPLPAVSAVLAVLCGRRGGRYCRDNCHRAAPCAHGGTALRVLPTTALFSAATTTTGILRARAAARILRATLSPPVLRRWRSEDLNVVTLPEVAGAYEAQMGRLGRPARFGPPMCRDGDNNEPINYRVALVTVATDAPLDPSRCGAELAAKPPVFISRYRPLRQVMGIPFEAGRGNARGPGRFCSGSVIRSGLMTWRRAAATPAE